MSEKVKATGLKWRTRADGREIPVWCASPAAIAAGYTTKTFNLTGLDDTEIASMCDRLNGEMQAFLSGLSRTEYDGTLGSVIELYMRHPRSPYRTLKPSSRKPYDFYLAKIKAEHGDKMIGRLTGLDFMDWHEVWRAPAKEGQTERLAAATTSLAVIKAALKWASVYGIKECAELREILGMLELPSPKPRDQAPAAADIESARHAARGLGRPRAAFGYAMQFETAMRQWDLIGQWVPLSHPQPSAILAGGRKWIGPTWVNISADLILSYTPTKTESTTGKRVHVDLKLCPMVVEELQSIPPEARVGPLVVNEATGLPYISRHYSDLWARVRERAGLSPRLWNRDIRAGALTEGGMAGASSDDRAKLAGHAGTKMTTTVYDRDNLVGANRVAEARAKFRARAT